MHFLQLKAHIKIYFRKPFFSIIVNFERTKQNILKFFKYIGLFVFILAALPVFPQQGILMKPLESDSAQMELERQMEYRQLISGSQGSNLVSEKITLPGFNDLLTLDNRYSFNFDFNANKNFAFSGISTGNNTTFYNPYFHNGVVLSEGAYSLNKKLMVGGFSYGANSFFSAPYSNPQMNNFDTYGSTIFMQYKVSKKFKIETRFNFSKSPGPHF